MKQAFAILIAVLLLVGLPSASFAQTAVTSADYTVQAEIPEATGIEPTVTKVEYVEGADDNWLDEEVGNSLNFGELELNTFIDENGDSQSIYLPDHYYAIDVGVNGVYPASGLITVEFAGDPDPNDGTTRGGLDTHATLTYKKVSLTTDSEGNPVESETSIGSGKYLMGDPPDVSFATLRGGWLRLYAGIVNLDPDAADPSPTGAEAFTPADMPGVYSGTITITFSPA
jgi:hypothetical protein